MNSSNRLWILVTAVLAVGILALGWFLGISPKLDEASATNESAALVNSLNQQQTIQLQKLKTDSANLPAIRDELAQLVKQLPAHSEYPAFLTELNQIAAKNKVAVTNVGFDVPTALAGATTGSTPAPGASAAPAGPAVVTNVVPSGTVVAIPTTMTMAGSFADLQAATGDLQSGDRLFLVSGLNFTKADPTAADDSSVPTGYKVDVTGIIYVLTDGSTLISSSTAPTPPPTSTTAP